MNLLPKLIARLGLIRGTLDQVDSTVDITWIQPRVLEGAQLHTLAQQIDAWCDSVGQTAGEVEAQRLIAREAVLVE